MIGETMLMATLVFANYAEDADRCANFVGVSVERAICYAQLRRWKESEAVYREYRRAHKDSLPAALGHVEALLHLNQMVEATQIVARLAEAHPDEPSVMKAQAWIVQNVEKDPLSAGRLLEKITRLAPRDADAWRLLGLFYLEASRPADAVECFERAVALDATSPLYRAGLGRALAAAGRDSEAAAAFERAIANAGRSNEPLVFLWYGDFLRSAGRDEESMRAYSRAIAMDPLNGAAWLKRAAAEVRAAHYTEAERDALEARSRGEGEREVQMLLVRVYKGLGQEAKAQAAALAVDAAMKADEDRREKSRQARKALDEAERLMKAQRFADALPLYTSVIADLPDFSEAWFAAGICYVQTGDAEHGEQALRTYLRLEPLSEEGHTALGVLLLSQKRIVEARAELLEALRLDPTSSEAKEALDALGPSHQ